MIFYNKFKVSKATVNNRNMIFKYYVSYIRQCTRNSRKLTTFRVKSNDLETEYRDIFEDFIRYLEILDPFLCYHQAPAFDKDQLLTSDLRLDG